MPSVSAIYSLFAVSIMVPVAQAGDPSELLPFAARTVYTVSHK